MVLNVNTLYFELEDPDDLRKTIFLITITTFLQNKNNRPLPPQGRTETPLGSI
jgi:hypothetical protein